MTSLLSYKYYDTPEGQDIFFKTFACSKYALLAGITAGAYDTLMFSHPKGFVNTAGRFMWHIGPLVGMAAGFAVATNASQNIRGKNDSINYFIGGAVAGSIFSAWQRSGLIALPAMLLLGFAGVLKKNSIDENWSFFPVAQQATKTIQSVRHDWTMVKDIEELKNWTTGN
ncbi:hypothetical protein K1T71_010486 [Dendrolimus kikuchii]|uniref:Uncharacterized protein n=1 Tax=Dendrolimus kikuchii TaxID=765133 RepID=A0ACC1CS36_9NEOP|nr:hypothetical protein K1T71_010486 [Dendrolimus kikuchii]